MRSSPWVIAPAAAFFFNLDNYCRALSQWRRQCCFNRGFGSSVAQCVEPLRSNRTRLKKCCTCCLSRFNLGFNT